jgi:hypothetical protein
MAVTNEALQVDIWSLVCGDISLTYLHILLEIPFMFYQRTHTGVQLMHAAILVKGRASFVGLEVKQYMELPANIFLGKEYGRLLIGVIVLGRWATLKDTVTHLFKALLGNGSINTP